MSKDDQRDLHRRVFNGGAMSVPALLLLDSVGVGAEDKTIDEARKRAKRRSQKRSEAFFLSQTLGSASARGAAPQAPLAANDRPTYGDLVDRLGAGEKATYIVRKQTIDPKDLYGDGCWRSSWVYASLLVMRDLAPEEYAEIEKSEGISVQDGYRFMSYFAQNLAGDHGFKNYPNDSFSRDQLAALMYFLACVKKYGQDSPAALRDAEKVVRHLRTIVSKGRSLWSDPNDPVKSTKGLILDNLKYVVLQLCDQYGVEYRWPTQKALETFCIKEAAANGLINLNPRRKNKLETNPSKIALKYMRIYLAECFAVGLQAFELANQTQGTYELKIGGVTILKFKIPLDTYSVFNSLGLLSTLVVQRGQVDAEADRFRKLVITQTDGKDWGPAYRIVRGKAYTKNEVAAYRRGFIPTENIDNDLVCAQRPKKFMDGLYPGKITNNSDGALVLDYPILRSFELLWRS